MVSIQRSSVLLYFLLATFMATPALAQYNGGGGAQDPGPGNPAASGGLIFIRGDEDTPCKPSLAEAYLDVGNVRARIFNGANLFWRGSPHTYEVPKGSDIHALFAAGIWIGGLVDDTLYTAAARYGNYEFWPGPLTDEGNPPGDCNPFDEIFEMTREDLEGFLTTGFVSDNLRRWPWSLGAPVIDGDGDPTNYNLTGGDLPELLGDQMFWWVMNDRGGQHIESDTRQIGMEIHGTAFAFNVSGHIGNTTYYRYKLHYKRDRPLKKTLFGIWADPDLGNFDDDFVGVDTMLSLAYTYNADNFDEGTVGYGEAPPAVGFALLQGPLAPVDTKDNDRDGTIDEPGERFPITSFAFYHGGGGVMGDPGTGTDYYNLMRGHWKDNVPFTIGGFGRNFSRDVTPFMYPGDPVTGEFWSERNMDGNGLANDPADRRFVSATGPFTMEPGSTEEIHFAVVWARGKDHLDSVTELRKATQLVHSGYDLIRTPNGRLRTITPPQPVTPELGFTEHYPNPFADEATIRYSLPAMARVRLSVYDILGREVTTLIDARQEADTYEAVFDAGGLPSGTYFYRLQVGNFVATRMMTLLR